ncbi:pfkB family kinase [Penicillium hispanicum]|uniref:pfkB family kinase n=1 Tax=Penicillium hispanicum TaxID=1080232 RepID=UPI00253FC451|nr:pfkB family kinase [Penicillium hispanicum]KAJ5584692.1 pfkB family kinase [Penicillium hispanicum]
MISTPYYPSEDEKLRASSIARRRGGNCPNTLEVLQQLTRNTPSGQELPLHLVSVLPARSSIASQRIRSTLEPHVQLDHCIYRENFQEPASSYIIKGELSGSRTIVNYNDLPEMTVDEFVTIADILGHQAAWFHFEGRMPDVTLQCIQHLRKEVPSVRISVEVEKPGRPGLQELAEEADVVFYSKTWAQASNSNCGYTSALECLSDQSERTPKASLLCCTWGQDGAGVFDRATGSVLHKPAYELSARALQVVDTVGAGDTFIAGMLYALNCKEQEWSVADKLLFAIWIAGAKVSQEGFSGLGQRCLLEWNTE